MHYRLSVIVLAAGRSARFGANKLMCAHPGSDSLLGYVVQQYRELTAEPVVVVTGAYHKELKHYFAGDANTDVHYNPHWQQGMGSSVAAGVNYVLHRQTKASHLLIGLGDQPYITRKSLGALVVASRQSPHKMVASAWSGKLSAPAIFPVPMAPQLVSLEGDRGAAGLLRRGLEQEPPACLTVNHDEAENDIDTQADWIKLFR